MDDLRRNAIFPLLLSRAILPKLRTASGPAGMVFLSSIAGVSNLLRLATYGATKAFLVRLSGCLGMDERFWVPTNVETCAVVVGSVVSLTHRVQESFFSPSSERYAQAMVDRFGCARAVSVPYWPHALQMWGIGFMPKAMLEKLVSETVLEEIKAGKQA